MSIAYGRVQDDTPDGGYINVLKIGIAFKAWAFCLGLFYIFMDNKFLGCGMTMGEATRNRLESEIADPDGEFATTPADSSQSSHRTTRGTCCYLRRPRTSGIYGDCRLDHVHILCAVAWTVISRIATNSL